MPAQLRLQLRRPPEYGRESFIVSETNAAAAAAVDAWPAWRDGALVLVGPPGSGKTHLAMSWAARAGAAVLPPDWMDSDLADIDSPVVLEDADQGPHGEALFHLINIAARPGCGLLITSRTPPSVWAVEVPDLRSRLNALSVAELGAPDDTILGAVLEKLFRERNIRASDELVAYLVRRIERSAVKAREIVARLDELADAERRPVSRALAREALYGEDAAEDVDGPELS